MFERLSIRDKMALALWGAALLSIAAVSAAAALYESLTLERRARQIMAPYAQLVSVGAEAAVAFEDNKRAQEILNTLRANPQILEAEIVLGDGRLLAAYGSSSNAIFRPHPLKSDGVYLNRTTAELIQSLQGGAHLHLVMSLDELKRQTQNFLLVLATAALVLLTAVTLGLMAALQRTIVRPISTLAETVEQVRARADFHLRVPASGADEVARLGRSFNATMEAIQERDNDLRRLTRFQRTLLDNAAYSLISTTPDGTVTSFNPAAERLLGYTADEVVGKETPALWHDADEIVRHALQLSEQLGETISPGFGVFVACPRRSLPEENEWTYIRKDGTRVPVLLSVTALRDENSQIAGFLGMSHDLTERKKAEAALQEKTEELDRYFTNARDLLCIAGTDGYFRRLNPEWETALGYSVPELEGQRFLDFVHPDDLQKTLRAISQLAGQNEVLNFTNRFRCSNGAYRWLEWRSFPSGKRIYAVAHDITERMQAEDERRKIEKSKSELLEKLNEAQRLAMIGSWEWNLQTNHVWWSDETYRIFGVRPRDFAPSFEENSKLIHPDDFERYSKAFEHSLQTGESLDLDIRLVNKDGALKHCQAKGKIVKDDSSQPIRFVGTVMDITERKQSEEALRRVNRELRAISDCNQTLLRATDELPLLGEVCRIVCEEAGYRMAWVGYAEHDEAKTIRPVAWAGVEEGYLAKAKMTWADTERGRGTTGTAVRTGKSLYFQDVSVDPNSAPWREDALQRGYRCSISLPLKDENHCVFAALTIYSTEPNAFTAEEIRLLEELADDLAFGIAVLRGRSERKRAEGEIRKLNAELEERVRQRTAQLEAANKELEMFSYSVSHDLRAPLRHISGFGALLCQEFAGQLDSKACDYIEKMQRGTKGMEQMVDELLELSRCARAELQLMPTDLTRLVEETRAMLKPDWEGRDIEWKIGPLPVLACDRTLMRSVFQNLLANAIKFTRQRSPAVIEAGVTQIGGREAVFVRDNGVGFDMKHADKLFGAFQRLHRTDDFEGTGVGLATAQRIIRKHGGEIWAEAEPDKGATFYFTLS